MVAEVDFAEQGLERALARLQASLVGVTPNTEHLYPFFETLGWLYGLHEWHKANVVDFMTRRDADTAGRTLAAVIWARGSVQHGLVDVTKLVTRPTSVLPAVMPFVLAGSRTDVFWLAVAQLPSRLVSDATSRATFYRELVAGQPLLGPLQRSRDYLVSLAAASAL